MILKLWLTCLISIYRNFLSFYRRPNLVNCEYAYSLYVVGVSYNPFFGKSLGFYVLNL